MEIKYFAYFWFFVLFRHITNTHAVCCMTPDKINSAVCRDTNELSNRFSQLTLANDKINQSEFALKRVATAKRGKNENTHVMIG